MPKSPKETQNPTFFGHDISSTDTVQHLIFARSKSHEFRAPAFCKHLIFANWGDRRPSELFKTLYGLKIGSLLRKLLFDFDSLKSFGKLHYFRKHLIFANLTDSRIYAEIECTQNLSVIQYWYVQKIHILHLLWWWEKLPLATECWNDCYFPPIFSAAPKGNLWSLSKNRNSFA